MQENYDAIAAEGAEVVVITADAQDAVKKTVEQLKADFVILSDVDKLAIDAYNAGDPRNPRIARPQTYIIDETGVIRWKFLDVRVGNRLKSIMIIEELRKL